MKNRELVSACYVQFCFSEQSGDFAAADKPCVAAFSNPPGLSHQALFFLTRRLKVLHGKFDALLLQFHSVHLKNICLSKKVNHLQNS